ncbi:hypothetical protein FXO37_30556 [Capsicum annuum]|nr:hypothetical protein FXO37_30556 [Capsicum annuum]
MYTDRPMEKEEAIEEFETRFLYNTNIGWEEWCNEDITEYPVKMLPLRIEDLTTLCPADRQEVAAPRSNGIKSISQSAGTFGQNMKRKSEGMTSSFYFVGIWIDCIRFCDGFRCSLILVLFSV